MRVTATILIAAFVAGDSPPASLQPPAPKYLKLYVYTTPDVRPRHAQIVEMALVARSRAHTSAFAERGGEPVLELGPVRENAWHWHWSAASSSYRKGTSAKRAWPFVAVLEYSGTDRPEAYVDWFRRTKHSVDPGAWNLDPARDYGGHISAETARHRDADWCYMALVDTPTGGVIPGNEWAIRARVTWRGAGEGAGAGAGEETFLAKGWWLSFEDTRKPLAEWRAELQPLVPWRAVRASDRRGDLTGVEAVPQPGQQLAVWGTQTVFTFPAVPPDVEPGRGFDR